MKSTVFFAGWGGDHLGWSAVPGVEDGIAANHSPVCVAVHELNFPTVEHLPPGDVRDIDLARLPATELFWASPACPAWTDAKGEKRYFDRSNQYTMFDEELGVIEDPAAARSRALVEQIPRYLRAMAGRGEPVLAGVMENVVQCRRWDQWDRWIGEIRTLGYETRLIALNSAHVMPRTCLPVPQSRDRLYVAYWLKSLGRQPDWDKWLRPKAWCGSCEQVVDAVQSWKKPGVEMGRYGVRHGQYVYRCPSKACRFAIVEPITTPASVAIDWTLPPGARIGDRDEPLADNTLERIRIGLEKFAGAAMLTPAGGTWRTGATSVGEPMPTRTTRETDALVVPPMVVQTSGRAAPTAVTPVTRELPTQTCRRELSVVIPPFIAELRGGGSKKSARPLTEPLATFAASGFHHGLVQPPADPDAHLLVPYFRTGRAHPTDRPLGTLTTRDRYALVGADAARLIDECTFRMLEPSEIRAGMAFPATFKALGDKRTQARGYGNAVTPAAAEVIGCALVEAITGTDIERTAVA
ncbi:DNA cytosine methyltransferase [Nocardia nova]|jgi:DNA (cytosine-5)-methyltransferase 1|uniref:DNA cytosine methyltransferase n=1 Tax=Nocardia nova TaxID=37330 RepID=UPI0007A3DEE1|nr:DNA cytosine methyltransferase [Nocardia nova]